MWRSHRKCAPVARFTAGEHVAKRISKEQVRNGNGEPITIAGRFQQRFLAAPRWWDEVATAHVDEFLRNSKFGSFGETALRVRDRSAYFPEEDKFFRRGHVSKRAACRVARTWSELV